MKCSRGQGIFVVLLLLAFGVPLLAEISVKEYRRAKSSKDKSTLDLVETYVTGLGRGFDWANAENRVKGQPPLYCVPDNLSLNGQNYIDILEGRIKQEAAKKTEVELSEEKIEDLLLDGLEKTFPCQTKK